ncbi:G-protein coupled receptor GRL101-like [Stylophora pistillata]|uniref:G-protein coupled receptor GRL101-like n=1 Tax=Stylophora pistillata TaxID=50429 RepID=UPI000C03FE5B|nr:G-protein coupled receptor GRL101-like [Stylophora pistillata]
MDNNSLAKLSADQFYGLSKLKDLRFHFNKIREMSNEQFKDVAPTIRFLYFHYNRMRRLPEGFLSNMPYLITATVDTNMMCCQLTKEDADSDYVYVDSFASCETMFRNRAPRTCIWAIGIMSLVGAIFVITWRMVFREKNIVQPIMLIHLAVSDGLMGIYLITISWKDAIWAGQYHLHDYSWRTSLACQIIGAIAVLSSEVSLMLLSLISADRLKNIVFPFHVGGLTNKATHALCFIIWIIGFIIAFLPTIGIQYFRAPAGDDHFYGKSVVCLPLQLSNDKAPGWEYSVVVFVGLNLTFVAFVVLAYLAIVINRYQVQAMSANTQRETALAKRVFFIILTDCVCWMPIIVIGLRSIVEKSFSTSGDLAVWIAVFVLPLNSAINPILYTLSTTQVRDVLKAKWQQLCRYFVAKCGRTKNGEGGRHTGTVQTLAMRALNTAGGEEGPNKEALEEPEKEQAEVPKHEDPRVEHTEPQDKEPQDIKRKKPPKPGQPETEPFESNEQITAQPKKTRTEDHTKSQNDAAANSQYEQQHADFSGEEEQNQGLDDDNDRSEAQETAEAPQTKTDGELSETMMDTAL